MSTENGPATTTGLVSFFVPPNDPTIRAYQHINADPQTGERKRNFTREDKHIPIENLRGKEESVSLDTAGFQFFHAPSEYKTFANDEEIKEVYYPESIELIKKLTGASRVELFDHSASLFYSSRAATIGILTLVFSWLNFQLSVVVSQVRSTTHQINASQCHKHTLTRPLVPLSPESIATFLRLTLQNF